MLTCEKCGAGNASTAYDPYYEEINKELIEVTLCEACFQERHDDI
jgi:hypothetical protein